MASDRVSVAFELAERWRREAVELRSRPCTIAERLVVSGQAEVLMACAAELEQAMREVRVC